MKQVKRLINVLNASGVDISEIGSLIRSGIDIYNASKSNKKVGTALALGSASINVARLIREGQRNLREGEMYHIVVPDYEERLYEFLLRLTYSQADKSDRRTVEAGLLSRRSRRSTIEELFDEDESRPDDFSPSRRPGTEVVLTSSPTGHQEVTFGGVTCYAQEVSNQSNSGNLTLIGQDGSSYSLGSPTKSSNSGGNSRLSGSENNLVLSFNCEADRDTFVKAIREHFNSLDPYRPTVWVQNAWGNFTRLKDCPKRDAESVILHEGQFEKIIDHVHKFVKNEEEYANLGIPWHTGLLFYGPPGTGKSSLATVLASELDYDTYSIALSSVKSDNALIEMISAVEPRSIVLIEEIDATRAATNGNDDSGGVTKQGLLNILDGATTAHGVIFIMTTNHIDRIQPEVLRTGRVDLRMEIGYLNDYQVRRMCEYFVGFVPENLPFITEDDMITPSDLVGVFRDHIDDLPSSGDSIVSFLEEKKISKEILDDLQI